MSVSIPSSFDVNCAPQRYLAGRMRESEMEGCEREGSERIHPASRRDAPQARCGFRV